LGKVSSADLFPNGNPSRHLFSEEIFSVSRASYLFTTSVSFPLGEGVIPLAFLRVDGYPPEVTCFQDVKVRRAISPTQVNEGCQLQAV